LLALLGATLVACGSAQSAPADGRLRVVATTGQVADAAAIVGGDRVQVTALMGPGIDPHLYVAGEGDVNRLQQADLIFYNGLFLEAQLAQVLQQIGERKPAIAVAETVDPALLLDWANYAGQQDPHVWFDVTLWMQAVEAIRDAYSAADPDHAATYAANAAAYLDELTALHAEMLDLAATLPAERRILVTAHDAFHYFGRAYGFEVYGLQGISTDAEASAADVRELADFIVAREIPAVFIETSVPVRTIEAVQSAVQARGAEVAIGGELFSDALGDADSPGGTYVGMVRHNMTTIVEALRVAP
jgi:manganese/zinc/iron transport system substrate-binding protein